MKIVVAGTGYVGLVTAVCLAEKGHNVTCLDIVEEKIKMLNEGRLPIYEPGVEELINKNREKLVFTINKENAYEKADVIFIGVGTPEKSDGSANLDYIYNVVNEIIAAIKSDKIIVIKSTVPIGTNTKIENYINSKIKEGIKVEVVSNPEFLSQGTAVNDTLNGQRIVLGVKSEYAADIMKEIYKDYNQEILITDRESAEMIKYASNDFLALKISYINEIANLCEIVGANIEDVSKGMGMDRRIGKKFLKAGIGYGGSCFPKDTKALNWMANHNGYELKTIKATIEVNERQKNILLEKARKYYPSFNNIKVAILGLTFKANTDDLRDAPSLNNIPILLKEGAIIKAFDPIGENNYKKIYPNEIEYCKTIEGTLQDSDICFIFTDWDWVKCIETKVFKKYMKTPIILDGRNCFKINEIDEGIVYESIGRKIVM